MNKLVGVGEKNCEKCMSLESEMDCFLGCYLFAALVSVFAAFFSVDTADVK